MTPKAKRRRAIVWCIDFALKTMLLGTVILAMLWSAGYFTAQAAPVVDEAMWDVYHAIMG